MFYRRDNQIHYRRGLHTNLNYSLLDSASHHDIHGDFKIGEQNTSRGDLANSRLFWAIFLRKNRNNGLEDEVTMTCAVLPGGLLGSAAFCLSKDSRCVCENQRHITSNANFERLFKVF
jgi:hypothetical protein